MEKRNTIADEMIQGFEELADALESGEDIGQQFNCYQMQLDLQPTKYTPALVKETRTALRASQAIFAKFLGVSIGAIRRWEQGTSEPKPMACRFMDEIRLKPDYWSKRLGESVIPKGGKKKPV